MKRLFSSILAVLAVMLSIMPLVSSSYYTEGDITSYADSFVLSNAKFFNNYEYISDVRVFRKLYSSSCNEISFLYKVTAVKNNKFIDGQFIVTLNTGETLSVSSVQVLKEDDPRQEMVF